MERNDLQGRTQEWNISRHELEVALAFPILCEAYCKQLVSGQLRLLFLSLKSTLYPAERGEERPDYSCRDRASNSDRVQPHTDRIQGQQGHLGQ